MYSILVEAPRPQGAVIVIFFLYVVRPAPRSGAVTRLQEVGARELCEFGCLEAD